MYRVMVFVVVCAALTGASFANTEAALGANEVSEISNEALNEGLNPNQAQIRALVEYFKKNEIRIEHADASYWIIKLAGDDESKVSLRTFPRHSSEAQMRAALSRINLAYILNPEARIAMSFPAGKLENPESKKLVEDLKALFLAYSLPVVYKPLVYSSYDKNSGRASLYLNEYLVKDSGNKAPRFAMLGLWKFEESTDSWQRKEPLEKNAAPIRELQKRQIYSRSTDQKIMDLTDEIGLFWLSWKENDHLNSAFVFAGPILCNDIEIGPAPQGKVASCVPFANCARAMFVPDPKIHCK